MTLTWANILNIFVSVLRSSWSRVLYRELSSMILMATCLPTWACMYLSAGGLLCTLSKSYLCPKGHWTGRCSPGSFCTPAGLYLFTSIACFSSPFYLLFYIPIHVGKGYHWSEGFIMKSGSVYLLKQWSTRNLSELLLFNKRTVLTIQNTRQN